MAITHTQNPVQQLIDELGTISSGSIIRCRLCGTAITDQSEALEIGLSHQHRYTNPDGISFNIRCYHNAPGCSISGTPTDQDSWFGGYRWQFASCHQCYEHLGWYYENSKQRAFFGLIPDRLRDDQASNYDT